MRVLQLSSEKSWRGGEQQIAYLLEGLNGLGVENHVAVRGGSAFEKFCNEQRIPSINLAYSGLNLLRSATLLKKYCSKNRIDLMHAHSAKSHTLAVLSAVMGNPTPLILSRRVDFEISTSSLTRWKYNHPSVKAIACVSDQVRRRVSEYVNNTKKCVTIYSGIDIGKFQSSHHSSLREELRLPKENILIGNTSALEKEKDYFTFIDTIRWLRDKGVKATGIIIGTGKLQPELQDYAKEKLPGSDVIFLGFRKDIPQILGSLDIFLITSTSEGLGTSVLDAFACNVPVVATRAGGIPEMVIDNRTGLTATARDGEGLSDQVLKILSDPVLKNNLITGARHHLANFTKEKMAHDTCRLYSDIISG